MSASAHPLFQKAPLSGEVTLSTGPAPTPYHVYDGHGLIILGICEAAAVAHHFTGQDVFPVLTKRGDAILVLFVCDFPDASHGPHVEFHITALAAPDPDQSLPNDPAAALAALATQPDWGVLSLHLWNDSAAVVAYNTEYLGLSAMQATGQVTPGATHVEFTFSDADKSPIASGCVRVQRRSEAGLMLRVMRHLGFAGVRQASKKEPSSAHVINRKCDVLPRNGRAQTWTAPDQMIVSTFDPAHDHLEMHEGPLARCRFQPKIIEHLTPFRFIYLHPDHA